MGIAKKSESIPQSSAKEWYDLEESSKILNLSEEAVLSALSRYGPLLRISKESKDQDRLSREAIDTLLSLSKGLELSSDSSRLQHRKVRPRTAKGLWTQILTWRKE